MKTPPFIRIPAFFALLALTLSASGLDFTEDFEAWIDGSYGSTATYTSANGIWVSNNALVSDDHAASRVVRFRNLDPLAWLE